MEINTVATLRSEQGEILHRTNFLINKPLVYRVEVDDMLDQMGYDSSKDFEGTIELEFYSHIHLFFPYPATVINYYGPNFSGVVHTAQRTYNDFEDMSTNSETSVPESGFNIYCDDDKEPMIGLINGPRKVENASFDMTFFNVGQESMTAKVDLGTLQPYQMHWIYPGRVTDLKSFLKGQVGAAIVRFDVAWIFPRLVAGNLQRSLQAYNITHSYYDCKAATADSDYWRPNEPGWHPASLLVPAAIDGEQYTNIYFYPIYSPQQFFIDVEVYDSNGECMGRLENVATIDESTDNLKQIRVKDVCEKLGLSPSSHYACRLVARTEDGKRLPSRVKTALDCGAHTTNLPSNICTNLIPFCPELDAKPGTFRWGPVLADQKRALIWLMNGSAEKKYERSATVSLTLYREQDEKTIERTVDLAPHGSLCIDVNQDETLREFFNEGVGWYTAVANNPNVTTYYFGENASGFVGGDHGF